VIEHIRVLSEEIGRRPSGTDAADEAVDYARGLLEGWGYAVEVQEFTATAGPGVFLQTTVDVTSPEPREIPAFLFDGSGSGDIAAPLIDAGTGLPEEFPADANGAVVLLQREDVPFADMAQRALDAGASAMVVANKEGGGFRGVLDPPSVLPSVAIPKADGDALRELLAAGAVEVSVHVPSDVLVRNVIARPQNGVCVTVSGGHLDSVPWSPGATDNASGSAAVLELARAAAASGMPGHCFALFGGEEIGLFGSERFVAAFDDTERERFQAYFNYDVVTSKGVPLYLGSTTLADEAGALADELAIEAQRGQLPEDVGSDHLSFLDAALPALMLTTPDFVLIHTPQDTLDNMDTTYLQDILDLGFALLREHGLEPTATPQVVLPRAVP
jgi:aminopeptidase YwaD